MRFVKALFWALISLVAAVSLAVVVGIFNPSEKVNALWIITASACVYVLFYRFYSSFLAAKVLALDNRRITPALRLNDGVDYDPTNKWVLFGHHFAAIAGAGPLIGPMLAAQFGYLPGFLWILIGATCAGAVHDMVILAGSVRRNGKSLAQIAREAACQLVVDSDAHAPGDLLDERAKFIVAKGAGLTEAECRQVISLNIDQFLIS